MRIGMYLSGMIGAALLGATVGVCGSLELPVGVTVRVPDGWEPMPAAMLAIHSAKLAGLHRPEELKKYDCGIHLVSATTNVSYPYLLVQVRHSGRVCRDYLNVFPTMKESLSTKFARMDQMRAANPATVDYGGFQFDAAANILWMMSPAVSSENEPLGSILALILTEQGVIHVAGYARIADFAAVLPVFEAFIREMTPAPGLIYRPRFSDSHPEIANIHWQRLGMQSLIILVLGTGALMLARRARR